MGSFEEQLAINGTMFAEDAQPSTSSATDEDNSSVQEVASVPEREKEDMVFDENIMLDEAALEEFYNLWTSYSHIFHNLEDIGQDDDRETSVPDTPRKEKKNVKPPKYIASRRRPKVWTFNPYNKEANNICRHVSPLVQAEVFPDGFPDFCNSCKYRFSKKARTKTTRR